MFILPGGLGVFFFRPFARVGGSNPPPGTMENVLKVAACTIELPCGEPGQILTIEARLPPGVDKKPDAPLLGEEYTAWVKHAVVVKIPVADAKWSPRKYMIDPGDFEVFMYSRRSLTEPYRWVILRDRKDEETIHEW